MNSETGGERLDLYLVRTGLAASRRQARELVEQELVRVNGRRCHKGDLVGAGDRVECDSLRDTGSLQPDPAASVELLFADSAAIVVNKPGLMPCHPLHPGELGTVMNGVAAAFPEVAAIGGNPREGGLVHRLDNGTSGALLIARTNAAFSRLRDAIRAGTVKRHYQALAVGRIEDTLEIDVPIGHHRRNRRLMVAAAGGPGRSTAAARAAFTIVKPLHHLRGLTLVSVVPRSGSRHQIRVHLSSAGFPIVGDELYGAPRSSALPPGRFWLHLAEIEFESPASGRVKVAAPLAPELAAMLA